MRIIKSISFGNGVILGVEKSQVLVGVVEHPEAPDLETEEWMVYDEHCWFELLAAHGFGQVHVSLLHTCVWITRENICRKWTLVITYFCVWNYVGLISVNCS